MNFKKIQLSNKETIEKYLSTQELNISDLNFTNLYIWHFAREISYAEINDCLVIKTKYPNQEPYFFYPIGNGDKNATIKTLLEENKNLQIFSLQDNQAKELEKNFENIFDIEPNRDRFDYVYNVEELINLNGKKYHKKKNHINKFLSLYPDFEYEEISEKNADEIIEAYQGWYELIEDKTDGLKYEKMGIEASLKNIQHLSISGGLIRINGEIVAFSFGEPLNSKMVVIHIEKANPSFLGVYQMINQQFLKHKWNEYKWANREEDLGIEGLRKAKLSYQPEFLVEKFQARAK